MKLSLVVFPGSNCDHDIEHVAEEMRLKIRRIWHRDQDLQNPDLVVLPGGFSFGDYLRTGALAKVSPVMRSVSEFAAKGGPVLGVCNGFQILCELGLLPGVLLANSSMRFLSREVFIKVENNNNFFTKSMAVGGVLSAPIAHFEGNYFDSEENLNRLESNGQVIFRYCNSSGEVDPLDRFNNPNGSARAIAGISNIERNVVGLMPHPERYFDSCVRQASALEGSRQLLEGMLR